MAKKQDINPRPKMLPEVKITATRIQKPKEPTVRLYPQGEISSRKVDSLKSVGLKKAIGEPMMRKGEKPQYGVDSSDIIRKATKRK